MTILFLTFGSHGSCPSDTGVSSAPGMYENSEKSVTPDAVFRGKIQTFLWVEASLFLEVIQVQNYYGWNNTIVTSS